MAAELSLQNPVLECFAFYATVCVLKLMFMGLLTSYYRITRKAFANPEDVDPHKGKVIPNHPVVERARRNHLNDLENVVPFVLVGVMYVLTGPSLPGARLHFRLFTAARLVHTLAYQCAVQPARGLAHVVSIAVIFSMAYSVLTAAMTAM